MTTIDEATLNTTADEIEAVLADLGAPCRVAMSHVLPGWIQFNLRPAYNATHRLTRFEAVAAQKNNIAIRLRRAAVRVGRAAGFITLQVAEGHADIWLDDLLSRKDVKDSMPTAVPIGIDENGAPLMLNIGSNTSNTLLSGIMGTGKTTLAHSLIIGLCRRTTPRQARVIICDPKRHDLSWMLPHVAAHLSGNIRTDMDDIARTVANVAGSVERASGHERETVLFLDELGWVLDQRPDVIRPLMNIMKRGREFGFRLIACEPIPGKAPIAGDMLASFHVLITGRQSNAAAAYNATGVSNSGAEMLAMGGDMLLSHYGELVRFRATRPPRGFDGQRLLPAPAPTSEVMTVVRETETEAKTATATATASEPAPDLAAMPLPSPPSSPSSSSSSSSLAGAWTTAGDEDRRSLVAQFIAGNACAAGVRIADRRGALSVSLLCKLLTGRRIAGDLAAPPWLVDLVGRIEGSATATATADTPLSRPEMAEKAGEGSE